MRSAEDPAVLHRRRAAPPPRHQVIHLQPHRRSAHAPIRQRPRAPAPVALHDLALHLRRHAGPPLRLLLEEHLQRQLQDLLVGRAGVSVRLPGPGLPEQRQELPGDRDVQPALRGGHGHDHRTGRFREKPLKFTQVNFLASGCPGRLPVVHRLHARHHRPLRNHLPGLQLRRQFQRLQLREPVEPRQDLRLVLLGHHGRQDRRGGEAKPSVLDRLQHLREPLHEPGRRTPVVGGATGELQSRVEVVEERCVAQAPKRLAAVELREGEEERALCGELGPEEAGEVGVEGSGVEGGEVVHSTTLSREFRASGNARGRPQRRALARRSRTSPGRARTAPARGEATWRALPERRARGIAIRETGVKALPVNAPSARGPPRGPGSAA